MAKWKERGWIIYWDKIR